MDSFTPQYCMPAKAKKTVTMNKLLTGDWPGTCHLTPGAGVLGELRVMESRLDPQGCCQGWGRPSGWCWAWNKEGMWESPWPAAIQSGLQYTGGVHSEEPPGVKVSMEFVPHPDS